MWSELCGTVAMPAGFPGRPHGRGAAAGPVPGAAELAGLLPAGTDAAIEQGGLTALLEAITGRTVIAEVHSTCELGKDGLAWRELGDDAPDRLRPGRSDRVYLRRGIFCIKDAAAAAEFTAALLPRRVPMPSRPDMGVRSAYTMQAGRQMLFPGRALRNQGIRRQQLETSIVTGRHGFTGARLGICSRGLLYGLHPVALVIERVFAAFLEEFPPPWPGLAIPTAAAARESGG